MKCSEIQENLLLYLKRETEASQAEEIESHFKKCQDCQQSFFLLKSSWNMMSEAREISPSPQFQQRVMGKVQQYQRFNRVKYLLSLAAGMLVLAGVWFFYPDPVLELAPHQVPYTAKNGVAEYLKVLGIDPKEESELVKNLEFLEHLPLLKKKELLENMKVINEVIPEEALSDEE